MAFDLSDPYIYDADDVIAAFESDRIQGLSKEEAERRLHLLGFNKVERDQNKAAWKILINQFKSPIVGLLTIASGLSMYFGDYLDAIAIFLVILINTLIGFFMEYQADRSMNALKKLSAIPAKVLRDQRIQEVNAEELVPGDIVFIEAGDLIAADGRVVSASELQVDESALTGESLPVEKQTKKLEANTVLADRINMVYKGTYSNRGNGFIVITATGLNTELGKIAQMVESADQTATPLEKKLEDLSKKLIWITLILVVLIFIGGLISGQKVLLMLETAIALAVAAVPEGLPIVATLALAQGMLIMARKNVIVKKLSAVETLGGTNIICTDKTGTLTANKIEVSQVITTASNSEAAEIIRHIAVLCNTAELHEYNGSIKELGDPLETGLLKYAIEKKEDLTLLRSQFPKVREQPFSSETKVMATMHRSGNDYLVFAKGAFDELLFCCSHIATDEGFKLLSAEEKEKWVAKAEDLAKSGLRVIAGAYKKVESESEALTENLVFVGLYGMIDPPKKDVLDSIRECKRAGIEVVMITGDHPSTAQNIAFKLGILDKHNRTTLTGKLMKDYEALNDEDKRNWLNTKVFARVNPKQKLDLVSVLQEYKYVVGMTGDGINDSPALKKADIGIAMGLRGTQVSQEVADMILKDDSFPTIVAAIKQGRIIFENIRKFVIFLLSCNLSELLVIAISAMLNLHFQLFPLQILFINLITDVLPALALGVLEGDKNVMNKPPRGMAEPILDLKRWRSIVFYSIVIGSVCISAVFFSHYFLHQNEKWNPALCNNILFYTLIFCQLLHVLNMGSNSSSFFKSEVFRNRHVWTALVISFLIVTITYLIEYLRKIFSLYEMSYLDWIICTAASVISVIIIQLGKKLNIAHQ